MASISTCFTITPNLHSQHSKFFSLKPNFHKQILKFERKISISYDRRFVTEIRAGFSAVEATVEAVRPGKVIETDKLSADVRKRAMDAVDKCGRRVTVGDVASKAGIKLVEAKTALQAIAADTNGFLEVSDEGDVFYVFPEDYHLKLAVKSLRIKTEPYLEKAKSGAEYLVRVAFGTTLVASIIIVFIAIFAILSSASDKKDRERSEGSSSGSRLFSDLRLSDFYWSSDPYYNGRRQGLAEILGIQPVFSFVFGDGDPNRGIEEERWMMIGQYIGSNGGVVTADELAPYLDVETATMDDDSYILPVLLRFDGQPQVDEEGNILYRFPSLQRTAASKKSSRKENLEKKFSERVGGPNKFLKEKNGISVNVAAQRRSWLVVLAGLISLGLLFLVAC